MRASPRSLRFWLIRGVPLAAVALGVALLIPADFNAAANTISIRTPAAPVKAAAMLPPPPVIAAGTLNMSSSVPYVGADAPQTQAANVPDLRPSVQPAAVETTASTPLPTDPAGDKTAARIAYSGVNVRAAADKGADKLFVLPPGAPVQVAESINGWVHVFADQGDGWVYKSYLLGNGADASAQASVQVMSPKPKVVKSSPLVGRIVQVASNVTVHDGPSADSDSIYSLDPGERVQIVEAAGGWARIATSDGESGWVKLR